ncbi:MAG: fructose-bisphosphatase class III [Clostridia bacterium]|nr:fructose-bisphosphatase class III [Clostridia bacterium]
MKQPTATEKYLNLLAREYPSAESAAAEMIRLSALRSLPKGTEYFFSDLHGEYESFSRLLRSASGMIRAKIDLVFEKTLSSAERGCLAELIYTPEEILRGMIQTGTIDDEWRSLTLYRLILGLYKPQKGRIYLDTDRGEIPVSAATRHLFAAVPQLPTLFSGTLRENLLLVKPDASAEELTEALALAECDFADALPDGLDTRLGELGEGLSAGQRQRISIARAILMRGRMLLLDEATSALDRETEQRVLQNLATHFPSVLIATHRPDVIRREGTEHLNLERSPDGETPEKNGVAEAYEG